MTAATAVRKQIALGVSPYQLFMLSLVSGHCRYSGLRRLCGLTHRRDRFWITPIRPSAFFFYSTFSTVFSAHVKKVGICCHMGLD